jgi:hypothetical protein
MTCIVLHRSRTRSLRHDPSTRAKPAGCSYDVRVSACSVGARGLAPSRVMACRTDRYVPKSRARRSWGTQRPLRASSTNAHRHTYRARTYDVFGIFPMMAGRPVRGTTELERYWLFGSSLPYIRRSLEFSKRIHDHKQPWKHYRLWL